VTTLEERIYAELEALGTDRAAVASKLYKMRCKGFRQSALECPISNFVRGREGLPAHARVFTDQGYAAIGDWEDGKEDIFDAWVTVQLPSGCRDFIEAFDRGAYWMLAARKSYRGARSEA
jgi:hypothetical protein